MTVSRVINNSGHTSREARERVEAAIAKLGYVPNALARGLRFKQTQTIALVVTDITNPFFTTVARGVEDAASEQSFSVMFCNTDESQGEELEYLNVLVQKQTDGVLLVPASDSVESLTFLKSQATPVVVVDRRVSGFQVDTVRCDSEQGAYLLVRYLIELGHRRIAALMGPRAVSTAIDRSAGYQRALAEAGLDDGQHPVLHDSYSQKGGYRMAREVLSSSQLPTALFAGNNLIAVGVLRALREVGLRVPEDISVVAFDDIPESLVMDQFLTVMTQPAYEIGRRATELLLDRLCGEGPADVQEIVLPTELVVRKSAGPPRPLA